MADGVNDDVDHLAHDVGVLNVCVFVEDEEHVHQIASGAKMFYTSDVAE